MAFKLKLGISGLCAFVPTTGGDPTPMHVVLVNARDFDHDNNRVTTATPLNHIHLPALIVAADYKTSGRRPSFVLRNKLIDSSLPNSNLLVYLLDKDDLKIVPSATSGIPRPKPVDKCPADTPDSIPFKWIARMADIGPKQAIANTDPKAVPDSVLARLLIEDGTCETSGHIFDPTQGNKGQKWGYSDHANNPLGNYVPRMLADQITADITINHNTTVTFESVGKEPIVIDGGGGTIRAFLFNTPLPDLLNDKLPTTAPVKNHHYFHFMRLAKVPTTAYAPTPSGHCDEFIGGLGGPKCPPTYFEG